MAPFSFTGQEYFAIDGPKPAWPGIREREIKEEAAAKRPMPGDIRVRGCLAKRAEQTPRIRFHHTQAAHSRSRVPGQTGGVNAKDQVSTTPISFNAFCISARAASLSNSWSNA